MHWLICKERTEIILFLFIWANAFEERKEIIFLSSNEDNWIIRDIMEIRTATIADLAQIAAVEAECFPAAEAATKEEFAERIKYYGNHFWLMFEGEKLIAFVDGFVTDKPDLTDEMYEQAEMHDENGAARGGVSRRRGGVPQLRFPQGGAGNRSRVTDGKRQNIRK